MMIDLARTVISLTWARGLEIAGHAPNRDICRKGTTRALENNAFGTFVFVDEQPIGTASLNVSGASRGVVSANVTWIFSAMQRGL